MEPWQPSSSHSDELAFLIATLRTAGYTEEGLEDLLDPSALLPNHLPAALWKCDQEDSARSVCAQLWLLHETVTRSRVERLVGADGLEALIRQGFLDEDGSGLRARVDLYPCCDAWVFTDHRVQSEAISKEHVYPLGCDSYTLARATPRRRVGRVLDLCTGSGIHAILAAAHSQESLGVDLGSRALAFARLNAAVQGARCRFLQGDLYEPVAGQTFDLILSNPPWVALPSRRETRDLLDSPLYRWGGITGEVFTERIVAGLNFALAPGGTLAMFVFYPVMSRRTYVERIRSWLGGAQGWGIAVADFFELSLPEFIYQQRPADLSRQDSAQWREALNEHGIEAMRVAMVYVRRLSGDHPGWAQVRQVPMPSHDVSASVERWLDALTLSQDPHWPGPEWRPRLGDGVRAFWLDGFSRRGRIEFAQADWLAPEMVDEAGTHFLAGLDGNRTLAELAAAWAAEKQVDPGTAELQVEAILRYFASRQIVA